MELAKAWRTDKYLRRLEVSESEMMPLAAIQSVAYVQGGDIGDVHSSMMTTMINGLEEEAREERSWG